VRGRGEVVPQHRQYLADFYPLFVTYSIRSSKVIVFLTRYSSEASFHLVARP
jgi:hypothetical protein